MGGHSAEALRLGKQTLCQLSYSRSAYAQSKRLLEREGHSSGRRRLPQRSYLDATALVQRITTHSVCLLTCATPRREHVEAFIIESPWCAEAGHGEQPLLGRGSVTSLARSPRSFSRREGPPAGATHLLNATG